jgi:Nucleotidyl transferase AbiEii toxin, Type IV TA system
VDHHGARMMTSDAESAGQCELDILRESFTLPPETTPYGPVLALDDVIGTKVRALVGRGLPRDLIDIHAASRLRTTSELEALGRRHAWEDEFSLEDLKFRLDGADWYDDQAFAEYGLTDQEIADLRGWAQSWSDDINRHLYAESYADDDATIFHETNFLFKNGLETRSSQISRRRMPGNVRQSHKISTISGVRGAGARRAGKPGRPNGKHGASCGVPWLGELSPACSWS